jgi:hypothetical protein
MAIISGGDVMIAIAVGGRGIKKSVLSYEFRVLSYE